MSAAFAAPPLQAALWSRILLAGGERGTLLSEAGPALLPFFTTRDACALRLVCQEFLAAVREHPWGDRGTVIKGSIAAWRACFPRARCANVQEGWWHRPNGKRSRPVVDADFVHLEGLRELHMAGCRGVTDAAFAHLRGIHTLDMYRCSQPGVTDAAFAHLRGIRSLDMSHCDQAGITAAAFEHLRGAHVLHMDACREACVGSARALGLPVFIGGKALQGRLLLCGTGPPPPQPC